MAYTKLVRTTGTEDKRRPYDGNRAYSRGDRMRNAKSIYKIWCDGCDTYVEDMQVSPQVEGVTWICCKGCGTGLIKVEN
ncbi:MAG: hypothetical protein PHE73_09110 [Sulfurovaceae bacterium]|nr:hypothetical protein [Sulfurovaceae bacterium]